MSLQLTRFVDEGLSTLRILDYWITTNYKVKNANEINDAMFEIFGKLILHLPTVQVVARYLHSVLLFDVFLPASPNCSLVKEKFELMKNPIYY